jgi:uncharacterized tellurite resistance protein B-like protein
MTDSSIRLTKKQKKKLDVIMSSFYKQALNRSTLPSQFLLLIKSISDTIKSDEPLEQYELDVVVWVLSLLLDIETEEPDILLEQLYHKITGFWYPNKTPYFDVLNPPKKYHN